MMLTMMLVKCPVLQHRSEQIRSGNRWAAASCRIPVTTRVQSVTPSDGTVVAADRRQHRRHHRSPPGPVLLRRTGQAAAADPPRPRRRRSRMQTRSTTTANDQQVHARRLARRSTTSPRPYWTSPRRRWDPDPNPQSATAPPESNTTPKPTPTPRIPSRVLHVDSQRSRAVTHPPAVRTAHKARQRAHTKTRSMIFVCCVLVTLVDNNRVIQKHVTDF